MFSSRRSTDTCQMCQSTDGELISLFPGNYETARLIKKIRTVSSILVEKSNVKQICRRCIYHVETLYVMKRYLTLAETTSKEIWKKPCNKEINEAKNPAHTNEEVLVAEIPGHSNEDITEMVIPAHPNEDIIEAEIPALPNEDIIQGEIPAHPNEEMEHDELSYNIEWISEEERIKAVNAFRRKWENQRKKKLEEAGNVMHEVKIAKESVPLDNMKNHMIKTEIPDEPVENDNKSDEHGDNMEIEVPMTENFHATVKTEYIETEELDTTIQSKKTDDEKTREIPEEKQDANVIVISDSDEHDSSDLHRQPLSAIPSDSSGIIGNSSASLNSQRGRKRNSRGKVPTSGKNASGFERKEITALKTTDGQATSSRIRPRKFFQCTRCNVNLYTVAAVLLHHNQVHTPNKASLICRMCDKTFPVKSDLFAHFNQHVESHLFRCPHCRSEFVLRQNLMAHIQSHKKRASLLEPRTANKRFRTNSQNSVEDHSQTSQYVANNESSLTFSMDASGNSEKENIATANMQILDSQNLDNNAVGRENGPRENDGVAANLPTSVVQTTDTILMEQEEEDRGNENGTTGNSVTPVVQSLDNSTMFQG